MCVVVRISDDFLDQLRTALVAIPYLTKRSDLRLAHLVFVSYSSQQYHTYSSDLLPRCQSLYSIPVVLVAIEVSSSFSLVLASLRGAQAMAPPLRPNQHPSASELYHSQGNSLPVLVSSRSPSKASLDFAQIDCMTDKITSLSCLHPPFVVLR